MTVIEITNRTHGCRETVLCFVNIPVRLSCTGRAIWRWKPIDKCLAPWVNVLNKEARKDGQLTAACCCGHGIVQGEIILHDGTKIPTKFCKFQTIPKTNISEESNDQYTRIH